MAAVSDKGASDPGVGGTEGTRKEKNIIIVVGEAESERGKGPVMRGGR